MLGRLCSLAFRRSAAESTVTGEHSCASPGGRPLSVGCTRVSALVSHVRRVFTHKRVPLFPSTFAVSASFPPSSSHPGQSACSSRIRQLSMPLPEGNRRLVRNRAGWTQDQIRWIRISSGRACHLHILSPSDSYHQDAGSERTNYSGSSQWEQGRG